jgi:hypothetical protein
MDLYRFSKLFKKDVLLVAAPREVLCSLKKKLNTIKAKNYLFYRGKNHETNVYFQQVNCNVSYYKINYGIFLLIHFRKIVYICFYNSLSRLNELHTV